MDWTHFRKHYQQYPEAHLQIDWSGFPLPEDFVEKVYPQCQAALAFMGELEGGAYVNFDENRRVGHYWLRDPEIAPNDEIRQAILQSHQAIEAFTQKYAFENILLIGIGGSALGPQLLAQALRKKQNSPNLFFFDNTDPETFKQTFKTLQNKLDKTLVIIISKSGKTPETLNGVQEAQVAFSQAHVDFSKHAVVITMPGSALAQKANEFLAVFPLWDWVGGRTCLFSSVGLLIGRLIGVDVADFLKGAKIMDCSTRLLPSKDNLLSNPALALALRWLWMTEHAKKNNLVILPYKDRLSLLGNYLQQLIMESLGKAVDLNGNTIQAGLTVYGNKGSTDQHAYIQQLRDGRNDFTALFIQVATSAPDSLSQNYLHALLLGTQEALTKNDRTNIRFILEELSAKILGALIALFERAVGFYAHFIHINAYHQPGVEAGKKAADYFLSIQKAISALLMQHPEKRYTLETLTQALPVEFQDPVSVFKVIESGMVEKGKITVSKIMGF